MARMKEIQKSKFIDWSDIAGKLTRFYRLDEQHDLIAGDVKPKELVVYPTTSTQVFTATDNITYDKVTVMPAEMAGPTVDDDTIEFEEGASVNDDTLSL